MSKKGINPKRDEKVGKEERDDVKMAEVKLIYSLHVTFIFFAFRFSYGIIIRPCRRNDSSGIPLINRWKFEIEQNPKYQQIVATWEQ